MKRFFYLLTMISLLLVSCDYSQPAAVFSYSDANEIVGLKTGNREVLDNPHFVSEEDIAAYVHYKQLREKRDCEVRQLSSITNDAGDVLLYIINYDEGWDVVAADKRATLPLGSSPKGSLDIETDSPIKAWLLCLSEEVFSTMMVPEGKSSDPMVTEYNIKTWQAILADESLFQDIIGGETGTRFDPGLPFFPPYPGHYVLSDVVVMPIAVDSIPHLIPVSWSQDTFSCNSYVPLKTEGTGRAPAGCVAVAGAQMLYYLHGEINVPQTAPSSAYCYGDISSYTMDQYDYSSTVWAQMDPLGISPYVGMLIASVAKKVDMEFHNTVSLAYTSDLTYSCFPFYGIASTFSQYNETTVKNSIQNGMPVIVDAAGFQNGSSRHTFIIDGYKRSINETIYVYTWEWINYDPDIDYPKVQARYEYSYSSPFLSDFYMNWGGGPGSNDGSFAVSGDWIIQSPYNFIYNRTMIYNFHNNNE